MASGSFSGVYKGYTLQTNWSSTPNTEGNYSTIYCEHYLICASSYGLSIGSRTNSNTVNGETKNFTSSAISTSGNSTILLGSTTYTVYHNSDGSKTVDANTVFYMKATISGTYKESITANGTMVLDNIPRNAIVTNATDFTDETNPTIQFKNDGGFMINARLEFAGAEITRFNIANTGSYTFYLTDAERELLRQKCTGKSMTVRMVIGTSLDGVVEALWSWQDKTMTIVNANPIIGTLSYKDNNAFTTNITEDNQRIIRNNSNLVFSIGTATALKYASISKYDITFNGVTKSITSAGDVDFGIINLSSNSTAILSVTDSRGYVSTSQITVIIDDWIPPTALISVNRKNNFYSETIIKADGTYSSLNGKNQIAIQYEYRKTTDKNTSGLYDLEDNVETEVVLDNNYEWHIIIVVSDRIGQTTYNAYIDKGIPTVFFDRHRASTGINCIPQRDNSLEVMGSFLLNNKEIIQEIDGWLDADNSYSYPIMSFGGFIIVRVFAGFCEYFRIYSYGGANKWAYSFNEILNHTYEGNANVRATFNFEESSGSEVNFTIKNTGTETFAYQVRMINFLN